jgi:hypothetical protein
MTSQEMIDNQIMSKCPMAKIESISDRIINYIRKKLKKKYGNDIPLRGFHAKSIGLVEASLEVDNLPPELSVGLFRQPGIYEAWIRFTNGSPNITADGNKAARGMAIKITGNKTTVLSDSEPEVKEQDIILLSSRTFYPATCKSQMSGVRAAVGNKLEVILNALKLVILSPAKAFRFLNSRVITPNILEETYHSCTPYSFGDCKPIKWAARPLKIITDIMPEQPGENFLRQRLIRDLSQESKQAVAFELLVQFQQSEDKEPIDDSAIIWTGKFHKVATLKIPVQELDNPERINRDNQTSFCPGHTIKEHAPLGAVNLIRSQVYKALALERIPRRDSGQTRIHKTEPPMEGQRV